MQLSSDVIPLQVVLQQAYGFLLAQQHKSVLNVIYRGWGVREKISRTEIHRKKSDGDSISMQITATNHERPK